MAFFAYAGFWTALITRPMHNGVLQDVVNGVPELHYNLFDWKFSVDANVSLFTPITIMMLVALWLVAHLNGAIWPC